MDRQTTRHLIELAEMASEGKRVVMVHATWREAQYATSLLASLRPDATRKHSRYTFDFPSGGWIEYVTVSSEPNGRRADHIAFDHAAYRPNGPIYREMLRRWFEYAEYIDRRTV